MDTTYSVKLSLKNTKVPLVGFKEVSELPFCNDELGNSMTPEGTSSKNPSGEKHNRRKYVFKVSS